MSYILFFHLPIIFIVIKNASCKTYHFNQHTAYRSAAVGPFALIGSHPTVPSRTLPSSAGSPQMMVPHFPSSSPTATILLHDPYGLMLLTSVE